MSDLSIFGNLALILILVSIARSLFDGDKYSDSTAELLMLSAMALLLIEWWWAG